jgi:RNA polymerase sigma-70 factor (ECF subfamily)
MDKLRDVFDTSYRRLVGQLYGVCGDLSEAEDVVSEAFARAAAHRRTFDAVDNPEAWLRTVAVNVARTRARRRAMGERLLRSSRAGEPRHPDLTSDRLELVAAMRTLPHAQREALALHYFADLPLHDIAVAVGVPVGTIKARLSRGRTALAGLLDAAAREDDHA